MGRIREIWDTALGRGPVVQRALTLQDAFASGNPLPSFGYGLEGSLSSVPLFAAVRLIADTFAATPVHVFREQPGLAKARLPKDPQFLRPLSGVPASWKTQAILSVLGRGNAYGYVTNTDSVGRAAGLVWLDPAQVTCNEDVIRPEFHYQGRLLEQDRLIHVPWVVPAGRVTGLSPIELFRPIYETGASVQAMTKELFSNGGMPLAHIQYQGDLGPGEADVIKRRMIARIRANEPLVTDQKYVITPLGLPANQVQFVEAARMTATQIASIFGVPAEEIGGDAGNSLTYSTVEQNDLKLSTRTMRPWYVRFEEALSSLLPGGQYVRFNADALVRADIKTRYDANAVGINAGFLTVDEARALEDRPPLTEAQRADYFEHIRPAKPAIAPTAPQEKNS